MNTRTALRKSVLIAPAVDALSRAETQAELEDAWFDFCDGFTDGSHERRELLRIYNECLPKVRKREEAARHMPRILGAG